MTALHSVAVIDIGSTAIRLLVAEMLSGGGWRIIDRANKIIGLGRDVFVSGYLSKQTMSQALQILNGFLELLTGYQIRAEEVQVIATSALREARNRDTFIDRVAMRTGFQIKIIEGIEENRLTYLAVQHAIREFRPQFARSNSIIIEVGGGSTEIMLLRRGKMAASHSLNIGVVRLEQQLRFAGGAMGYLTTFLQEHIRTMREALDTELRLEGVKYFIAVGGDARLAAEKVGKEINDQYWIIERETFLSFVARLQPLTIDECVSELQIPYASAEGLLPGLLIYKMFMEGTSAEFLIVPNISIREGVLLSLTAGRDRSAQEEFRLQVRASALSLGEKYHFDEKHAQHVALLSLSLFDQLQNEHGLDSRCRLLLEISALLHDIGTYVRTRGHHKHGQYLVANSEIFGLSGDDINIISNVVRYHRKSTPNSTHQSYVSLSRDQRIVVLKLSAILRLADALDKGHGSRIKEITAEKTGEELYIRCDHTGDITLERFGIVTKGEMFEEVFGLKVVII